MIKDVIKNLIPYGMMSKYIEKQSSIRYQASYPKLYNEFHEEMIIMYLDDSRTNQYCLMSGRYPRRILWDRSNKGLNQQMYSHKSILQRVPKNDRMRQYGIMTESESICPEEYDLMLNNSEKVKTLDALFTYSERLLDKYDNAKFSISHGVWYGTDKYGGIMSEDLCRHKSKLISIVASAKTNCPLHVVRRDMAIELKRRGIADAMGKSVGDYFEKISDAFDDYMYNVAIENDSSKYYFTEKILNCFASMTIPVYYGAWNIGDFFNLDGIIILKEPTIDCLLKTVKQCSESDYQSRIDAIKDNFHRVKHYLTIEDYLTENYWDIFNI